MEAAVAEVVGHALIDADREHPSRDAAFETGLRYLVLGLAADLDL